MTFEREVTIRNREGLHFRPIMQVVDLIQKYKARVTVHCADRAADARRPMELLMLVATEGSKLRVVADGDDAEPALQALERLVESGFGEA